MLLPSRCVGQIQQSRALFDNFIDDVQPHDEADFDGTQPISGPSGLV